MDTTASLDPRGGSPPRRSRGPRAPRRVDVVALVLLALVAAGCGGSTASPDPADPGTDATSGTTSDPPATSGPDAVADAPDPCGLLTSQDLVTATGHPFGAGVPNEMLSNDAVSVCDWVSEDPFATAQVLLVPGGDLDDQRAQVEAAFEESTVALDLGDGAYRTEEGSVVAMLVGGLFVQVAYIPPGPGEVAEVTVALAELVLARL